MSIESFIKKICVEVAVYWGSPVADGYGGFTFAAPVELKPPNGVRWDNKISVKSDSQGMEQVCDAEILIVQDVDLNGYIYLGTLASLTTAQKADPMILAGARQIINFEKTPMIKSTTIFVRKVSVKRNLR
jgi:hypothetical protein